MQAYLTIANNGTIQSWHINGIAILTTLQHNSVGEERGGLPLCVPMFSTQQRPVAGSTLPLHGLLMYQNQTPITTIRSSDVWQQTHNFKASDTFAWEWNAQLSVRLTDNSLVYGVNVERAADCTNPSEMPLSLGFHPYFNTFGADFSFCIGNKEYAKGTLPNNIIDSDFAPLKNGEAAVLRTAAHTITITPEGYDEYCLWSDNVDEYFCIEPIYQYREFGLPGTGLQPGQRHETSVSITVTTNN